MKAFANGLKQSTVQFLWVGGNLSVMERLCLRSFVAHGYEPQLYAYEKIGNVPAGVAVRDAREILPESKIFTYQEGLGKGSYAGFANLFRYHLLHQKGGWWFDMDFVLLRPLPQTDRLLIASSFESPWGAFANNCTLHAPVEHPAIRWLRDETQAIVSSGSVHFGETGPFLVQRLVKEQNLHDEVAPWWQFSPYPWTQISRVAQSTLGAVAKDYLRLVRFLVWQRMRPGFRAGYIRRGTCAIHLYNQIWKTVGLDKNASYHPLSMYEQLKRRYGVK